MVSSTISDEHNSDLAKPISSSSSSSSSCGIDFSDVSLSWIRSSSEETSPFSTLFSSHV